MPGAELTLLAVYFAGLIFTIQHIAERYSPVLAKRLLRNWRTYLPVSLMSIIVVSSLLINQGANQSTIIFLSGMVLTLYGLLNFAFDQRKLIKLMGRSRASDRIICYEDCLSGAMSRMDERTAELIWREIERGSSDDEVKQAVILWAIDDDRFLDVSWAFTKLYRVSIPFSLKIPDFQQDVFRALARQLDRNLFDMAEGFVDCALDELRKDSNWTTDSWEFVYEFGNTLWLKGREEGIRGVSSRLENLHTRYIVAVYEWIHIVLESHRTDLVEGLTQAIGGLMQNITFANGADDFVNRYSDLVDWAFQKSLATDEVLHTAANSLGNARLGHKEETPEMQEDFDDWIDGIIVHCAAYLVEINGRDVGHLLANGRIQPGRALDLMAKEGVQRESYLIAAESRGIRINVTDYVAPLSIVLEAKGEEITV